MNDSNTQKASTCKLDTGEIRQYYECTLVKSDEKDPPQPSSKFSMKYLGTGVIYSLNGVIQKNSYRYHFWMRVQENSTQKDLFWMEK